MEGWTLSNQLLFPSLVGSTRPVRPPHTSCKELVHSNSNNNWKTSRFPSMQIPTAPPSHGALAASAVARGAPWSMTKEGTFRFRGRSKQAAVRIGIPWGELSAPNRSLQAAAPSAPAVKTKLFDLKKFQKKVRKKIKKLEKGELEKFHHLVVLPEGLPAGDYTSHSS